MLLRIVAIRHAKPLNEGFSDEKLRPLSQEGISIQKLVAQNLKELGIIPNSIYCSPLIRAKQTAEVVQDFFGNVPLKETEALGYHFDKEKLFSFFSEPKDNHTLFLVGHAPHLGEFINELVGEVVLPLGLCKSGVAVVDFHDKVEVGKGQFAGYYTPDQ